MLEESGELVEQLASLLRGLLAPWSLECLSRGGDGDVHVFLTGLVDGADDLFGGWVDDLEGLAFDTLDEFVVDEPAGL